METINIGGHEFPVYGLVYPHLIISPIESISSANVFVSKVVANSENDCRDRICTGIGTFVLVTATNVLAIKRGDSKLGLTTEHSVIAVSLLEEKTNKLN